MKQSEIIKKLSDKELNRQLIFSQLLLLIISVILSFILFDNLQTWFNYIDFSVKEIFYYGILPGILIVLADLFLMTVFPERYYDDGGINERIFSNRTILGIVGLSLLVAVTEEMLFRGVIQTQFGYIIASLVFALIHIRYLRKPVLFISVLFISFYIGYIFLLTNNLLVTVTAHFTVDCVLGLLIRFKSEVTGYGG